MPNQYFRCALAAIAAATLLAGCGGDDGVIAANAQGGRAKALSHTSPALADAPPGLSGSVQCAGLRIGAVTVDNVEVPAGMTCKLDGTTVLGGVRVLSDSVLLAGGGVQVAGSIQSDGAAHVELTGLASRVAGNFELKKGGSGLLAGAEVVGTVVFEELSEAVAVGGARAGGGMKLVKNTGGATVSNNVVLGALKCFDNTPAPANSGNSANALEGQCFQTGRPKGTEPTPSATRSTHWILARSTPGTQGAAPATSRITRR